MNIAQPRIKTISMLALFIGLSVIGSMIKLPSPFGTVALDSAPAFVAALLISPASGAVVGFFGHLATSMNMGFPLSILIHLYIAVQMAGISWVIGYLGSRGKLQAALILGSLLNGVAAPALLIPFDGFGQAFFLAMLLPLAAGAVINLSLTGLIVKAIGRKWNA